MKLPLYVSRDIAMQATGWTERHLRRSCQSRPGSERGPKGKPLPEYLVSSLPVTAQEYIASQFSLRAVTGVEAVPHAASIPPQLPLLANIIPMRAPAALMPRIALPPAAAQEAAGNLDLIRPLLDYDAEPARYQGIARSKSAMVAYLAQQHGVSEATVWRLHRDFRRGGVPALATRIRSDKGRSRWAHQHQEAAALVAAYWLNAPNASVMDALSILTEERTLVGLQSAEMPSYETLRSFLNLDISEPFRLMARKGKRAYEARCARYVKRGYRDVSAGQIYVSDHMVHDVYVANDVFGACDMRFMRLRLTLLMDFRSRRPVGYSWSEEGSSRSITTAFRHAFQNFGPCQILYCDNGKDYRKVAKGAQFAASAETGEWLTRELPDAGHGLLRSLGVQVIHCIPHHPQSKHIERTFGTAHRWFDSQWETYTGKDAVNVPDLARVLLAQHEKALTAGKPNSTPLPSASRFIAECRKWIESEWVHMPHTGEAMDGRTPDQAWREDKWLAQPPKPSPDQLAVMLCEKATAIVRNDQLRANKTDYVPLEGDAQGNVALHLHSGREVLVAFDPCDTTVAAALDKDGHLICHLRQKPIAGMYAVQDEAAAALSKHILADSMRTRQQLAKGVRDAPAALAKFRASKGGRVTAFPVTHELPAAVGEHVTHRPARAAAAGMHAPKSAAEIAAGAMRYFDGND